MTTVNKAEVWILLIALCALVIAVYLKSWIRSVLLALSLPGPAALPFIGNALLVSDSEKLEHLGKVCYEKYGRIFRAWISIVPVVFVLEPKDIQTIIGNNKHNDKNFIYSLMHNFIGEGLISNSGQSWKLHRKLIQPYFHVNVLQFYINSFSRSARQQLSKLDDSTDINITSFVNDCVLDILHETILGIPLEDVDLKEESPFRKGTITVPMRIKRPWYLIESIYHLTSIAENELQQKSKLHEYTRKILEKHRRRPAEFKTTHKSLLEAFIEISESNPDFTDDDIVNEICTFMLAGQDSVSAAVAFTLHHLGKHEDVQAKVTIELDDIFEGSCRTPDLHDLNGMKYLEQCVKETLRLSPSVPMFARKLSDDVSLGKYTIPSGCNVFISPFATHHLAHVYADPEVYDPERFSSENSERLHPFAFIPFSAGPRNCIGSKFALLEIKTILAIILRTYHICSCPGRDWKFLYRITLRAKGGVWIKLRRK